MAAKSARTDCARTDRAKPLAHGMNWHCSGVPDGLAAARRCRRHLAQRTSPGRTDPLRSRMGGIFDLEAGASQDLVLSRPGTLSSTTLARLARLARWQAAPAGRPEGTTGKQLSYKQWPYRVNSSAAAHLADLPLRRCRAADDRSCMLCR